MLRGKTSAVIAVLLAVALVAALAPSAEARSGRSSTHLAAAGTVLRIDVYNATETAIIGMSLGEAVAQIEPVAPGKSMTVRLSQKPSPCVLRIILDFEDGTQSAGDLDVCRVRRLTVRS